MSESIVGIKIKNLPQATESNLTDTTDLIIEDTTPKTMRASLLTFVEWLKDKLKIGNEDISSIGDGTLTGAVAEMNSNLSKKQSILKWGQVHANFNANGDYKTNFKVGTIGIVSACVLNNYADISINIVNDYVVLHSNVGKSKQYYVNYCYYEI